MIDLESYTCGSCGNTFYVEDVGEFQEFNMASYCAYCGVEFEWIWEDEAEA